jgi:hypothetical protein
VASKRFLRIHVDKDRLRSGLLVRQLERTDVFSKWGFPNKMPFCGKWAAEGYTCGMCLSHLFRLHCRNTQRPLADQPIEATENCTGKHENEALPFYRDPKAFKERLVFNE